VIIAVAAIKGGVGKTTVTFCLAAALNRRGKKVLCVDLDSQGDLSASMGLEKDASTPSIGEILNAPKREQGNLLSQAIVSVDAWSDLITSGTDLQNYEREIEKGLGSESRLRDALNGFDGEYDFILLDTPKGKGLLTINALVSCQQVLVPVQTEWLALKNLPELVNLVSETAERANPEIVLSVVVPNQMKRTSLCNEVYGHLKAWDAREFLPYQQQSSWTSNPVYDLTLYAELSAEAVPIYDYRGVQKRHLEPFEQIAQYLEQQTLASRR